MVKRLEWVREDLIAEIRRDLWRHLTASASIESELLEAYMGRPARRIDQSAARTWVAAAVFASYLKQHQIAPVFELYRKPVPPDLALLKKTRAELVVHPAQPRHVERLAAHDEPACSLKPRDRIVVARVAFGRSLLAYAARPVNHFGPGRSKPQIQFKPVIARPEQMIAAIKTRFPVFVPHAI